MDKLIAGDAVQRHRVWLQNPAYRANSPEYCAKPSQYWETPLPSVFPKEAPGKHGNMKYLETVTLA